MKLLVLVTLLVLSLNAKNITLEVLGSGGPELDGRASTSYVLWIDNKAKLIVDMGSGSMLRFEQSGAKLIDLDTVVLTRLHIDHSVDLASFVKAGYFTNRTSCLEIIAPYGNDSFPSIDEYLTGMFGSDGIYRYMQDVLRADSDSFKIAPVEIAKNTQKVIKYKDFTLTMISVHHGMVPAIALRIDVDGKRILITGDTNNQNKHLNKIANNIDLFVAHHAITQSANGYAAQLHVRPSAIAKIAKQSNTTKLLLTHRMNRTIGDEKETSKIINKIYKGKVVFAEDRMKIKL